MLCLSRLETLGVKLRTALSCAFEDDRYGRTWTTPAGVAMTLSSVFDNVVVISTVSESLAELSRMSEGGLVGVRGVVGCALALRTSVSMHLRGGERGLR